MLDNYFFLQKKDIVTFVVYQQTFHSSEVFDLYVMLLIVYTGLK